MVNLAFSHLLDRVAILSLWGVPSSLAPLGEGIAVVPQLHDRII